MLTSRLTTFLTLVVAVVSDFEPVWDGRLCALCCDCAWARALRGFRADLGPFFFALGAGELVVHFLLDGRHPGLELGLRPLRLGASGLQLRLRDSLLGLMLRVHLVAEAPADGDQDDGHGDHRLDRRAARLGVHLEAHPLLVDAHLSFDARPALGLLQAHLIFARPRLVLLLGATNPFGLFALAALLRLAGGALGRLLGGPLRLPASGKLVLLQPDAIVLDPTQLLQRKQNRILTSIGHRPFPGNTICRGASTHAGAPAPRQAPRSYLNCARSLSIAALSRPPLAADFFSSLEDDPLAASASPPLPLPLAPLPWCPPP